MNNLINLISSGLFTKITETPSLQLSEIPVELQSILKPGQVVILNILSETGKTFMGNLEIDGQFFDVSIKNNFSLKLPKGETITLNVKVGSAGRLLPYVPQKTSFETTGYGPTTIFENKSIVPNIEISPLKPTDFITQIIKDYPSLEGIKQQIADVIGGIKLDLNQIGNINNTDNSLLQPLKNVLFKIAQNPQEFSSFKAELNSVLNNLTGKQIEGEIFINDNNQTIVKTILGETYLVSKAKIPTSEKILLEITGRINNEEHIKLLQDLIKTISSDNKEALKQENILKAKGVELLKELLPKIETSLLQQIINTLPVKNDNIVESIYNFYKAVIDKDITRIFPSVNYTDNIAGNRNINSSELTEINNFMAKSIRETISWRVIEMPLFDGTRFFPLKIAVKKDSEQAKSDNRKKGTRFLVETEFSKLGSFQFDGFSSVERRSLDLIVRTSKQLDDDFCSCIINLFKKSLYDVNYSGAIKINCQQNFIKIPDKEIVNKGVYI